MPVNEGTAQIPFKSIFLEDDEDLTDAAKAIRDLHIQGATANIVYWWIPPTDEQAIENPGGFELAQLEINIGASTRETAKAGEDLVVVIIGNTVNVMTTEQYISSGYPVD
jgi:hypothetical protein